ncbi:MAG: sialidase [Betaproteobacteria bacterium]
MSTRPSLAIGAIAMSLAVGAASARVAGQRRAAPSDQAGGRAAAGPLAQLRFRYIGPVGNRMSAVAGVPGDPLVYYAGAASGGIFKTTDGGATWQPIFDGEPVASIGSLAVAPGHPEIVWAGTGETWIRSHISVGAGIYKSTDAGRTWSLMGLENTGRIGRIVIDPQNPDVVFAAALGHSYGPQPDRGLFRTTDGGRTWQKVLFVDENTGCSDVVMDPGNPQVLFAGMWQFVIHTWAQESGGPGSGLFKSTDGGTTWTRLTGHGLPEQEVGKIGLATARNDPKRVYALIETGTGEPFHGKPTAEGELWRSDDGGENWRMMTPSHDVGGRPHYYFRMAVEPDNADDLYFLTASFSRSQDGGATLHTMRGYPATAGGHALGAPPLGDFHDMWIDPANADRMIVSNDGGVGFSVNRGRTWQRVQFPNAQVYHVAVDDEIPYNVYGNRQDGPSFRGPSNSRVMGYGQFVPVISRGLWQTVGGGESGWTIPDWSDPNIVWSSGTASGSLGGSIDRYDERTRQYRSVEVWPDNPEGWPAGELKYRFNWTFPVAMSPFDHNRVWVGSQYVHETTDGGQSWHVISPDLTLNDRSRQGPSGGLTGDNIGPEYGDTLISIAGSPKQDGVIWTGSNDGQVNVTRDGGKTWTNVTANIPDLPPWGTIYTIAPSHFDAGTAYITVDLHQENNRDPYVYKTADFGATWKSLSATIPHSALSYAHSVAEDPAHPGLLFLGTENALYVSFDDGGRWQPLQNNLPHVPVYGITVQPRFHDLVLATYGRGFWILDDITPLERLAAGGEPRAATLFPPRPAYRFRGITPPAAPSYDLVDGQNPPYGADIDYFLPKGAGEVGIAILDDRGEAVRTLRGTNQAGVNRVWWDLRSAPSEPVRLRTSPIYAPWMKVGPEGRPAGGRMSLLMPPGRYTVKLTADGESQSQPLVVLKDPHSAGTEADIQASFALARAVRDDIVTVGGWVNTIEQLRRQIEDRGEKPEAPAVRAGEGAFERKAIDFEGRLYQLRLTGGQDGMRWGGQLLQKLSHLAGGLQESDFPPTAQQLAVREQFAGEIRGLKPQFDELTTKSLADLNRILAAHKEAPIALPAKTP